MAAFNLASKMAAKLSFQSFLSSLVFAKNTRLSKKSPLNAWVQVLPRCGVNSRMHDSFSTFFSVGGLVAGVLSRRTAFVY